MRGPLSIGLPLCCTLYHTLTHVMQCEASPPSLLCHTLFLASHCLNKTIYKMPSSRNHSLNTPTVCQPLFACTQCIHRFFNRAGLKNHTRIKHAPVTSQPPSSLAYKSHQQYHLSPQVMKSSNHISFTLLWSRSIVMTWNQFTHPLLPKHFTIYL